MNNINRVHIGPILELRDTRGEVSWMLSGARVLRNFIIKLPKPYMTTKKGSMSTIIIDSHFLEEGV